MHRRSFILSSASLLAFGRPGLSLAMPPTGKVVRVGWLTSQREASLQPFVSAFRAGFADLGYVEGRNLFIEFRYGDDQIARVSGLAAELERLGVDVIIVQGAAVNVVDKLKLSRPVVYIFSGDPIAAGFADSLAKPHANMTGLTLQAPELNSKRLELLRQILPQLQRVAIVANPEHPGADVEHSYSESTAARLVMTTDYYPTKNREELEAAFRAMMAKPPEAISLFADGFAIQFRKNIIDFAMTQHIPVISGWPVFAESGALCTYGPRLTESYRRLASYVDRVVNGVKLTDLPIERPTKFDLVVNLRTARLLNITIPQSVLIQADTVIE